MFASSPGTTRDKTGEIEREEEGGEDEAGERKNADIGRLCHTPP